MEDINQQTPGPLTVNYHGDLLGRGCLLLATPEEPPLAYVENYVESGDNANLLASAYNAFDKAGRALNADATELAQRTDLVSLLNLAEAVETYVKMIKAMPDDSMKSRHLGLALNNRPGERMVEALEAITNKSGL